MSSPLPPVKKNCLLCKKDFLIKAGINRAKVARGGGKYCSHPCYWESKKETRKGYKHSSETKAKIKAKVLRGEKSPFWRGGTTPLSYLIKANELYRNWRKAIFERDNYTCLECGERGGELHVDHIKPFSLIIFENKINSLERALNCFELWEQENGRTLCAACHRKTETYGRKMKNFMEIERSKI